MSPSKGRFSPGQAYVAFSRVREFDKLHIIKYTREQIKVSPSVAGEMDWLHKNVLPKIPQNLFHSIDKQLKIVHLNVRNILTKLHDMRNEDILKQADIICVNETHMSEHDKLTPEMMNITENFIIFWKDRNKNGGGVAVIVNETLNPDHIPIDTHCEVVAVQTKKYKLTMSNRAILFIMTISNIFHKSNFR